MQTSEGFVSTPMISESRKALDVLGDELAMLSRMMDAFGAYERNVIATRRESKVFASALCTFCFGVLEGGGVICGICFADFRYPAWVPSQTIFSDIWREEHDAAYRFCDEVKAARSKDPNYMRGVNVDPLVFRRVS